MQRIITITDFLIFKWGNSKMSNITEVYKTEEKNKDASKKEKLFSLFNCTKEEFKEWFDPI